MSDPLLHFVASLGPRPGDTLESAAARIERALRAVEMGTAFANSPAAQPASSLKHYPLVPVSEGLSAGKGLDAAIAAAREVA
jgi:hypothetical protein